MSLQILTPVGRLVQGAPMLQEQKDDNQQVKRNDDGTAKKQCFMAIAIDKNNPEWPAFYAQLYDVARKEFPHLIDASGNIGHPQFSWKIQDGDGVDTSGKSVADKPGFKGHWILKMATMFMPKFFRDGAYSPHLEVQNPTELIHRGDYIKAFVGIRGNGVKPTDRAAKPGVYVSPEIVAFVGAGERINSGVDAEQAMGNAPTQWMPPGMSAVPTPGAAPTPPAPPVAPSAAPPPPPPVATHAMLPKANGVTYEAMIANGWTDDTLRANGYMA